MSKLSLGVEKAAKAIAQQKAVVVAPPILPTARVTLSETGLALPEDYTFDEWEQLGLALGRMERSVQWWVGDWIRFGERRYGEMYAQALDATGRDYGTLQKAVYVADKIELFRRRNNLSWSHHAEVAALPPAEQDVWLDTAEAGALSVMDLRSAIRRARATVLPAPALPAGKYAVLLADPPWRYDFIEADNRAIENQYPTLTADEIACYEDADGRPVADLAADDAVLYLWATNPKLIEAMTVMAGWGFEYVTNMVWVKDRVGMGYWARQRHELLLIGRRGEFSPPPEHLRPDSVMEAPRTAHSEKPATVHELIEAVWSDAPKVEVFAREPRPGWAVFGNQVG
jgi:N6-adenosine-specific RNA methylase IME4